MSSARQKIQSARTDLVLDQPFWGALALRLKVVEDPGCQTAWTDGTSLGYDPDFVMRLTHDEVVGVIAHEVMHCANGHMWRRDGREHRKWNIACLAEGTPILMADGSARKVERIAIGDYVESPIGSSRVLGVMFSGVKPCVAISYNGSTLECTSDHQILTCDRGLINAAQISEGDRGLYRSAARQSGSERLHLGELQDDESCRVVPRYQGEVLKHLAVLAALRTYGEPQSVEAIQPASDAYTLQNVSGVLSRYCGRRGNGLGSALQWSPQPAAVRRNQQYGFQSTAVVGRERILRVLDSQRRWQAILAHVLGRLSDGWLAAIDPTILDHQSETRRPARRAYRDSCISTLQSATDGAYAADCLRDSRFEPARFSLRRQPPARRPVYDVITEKHFVIAAGLIVHNCDYAINTILAESGFRLPAGCLRDPQYDHRSSEWIYARLPDSPPEGGQGKPGSSKGGGQSQGQGKGQGNQPDGAPAVPGTGACDVRDAPAEEADGASEADWQQAVQQAAAAAKGRGKLPASLARLAEEAAESRVDWRSVLHRFVQQAAREDYSWVRPNPRYLASGLYLPALHSETVGPIAVAIDTSGSIDGVLLNQFVAELRSVVDDVRPLRVHVIWCDAKVHKIDTFERDDALELKPIGAGGTAFGPVMDACEAFDEPPSCLIYLTDLNGLHRQQPPDFPVLWAATQRRDVPYGEVVMVD